MDYDTRVQRWVQLAHYNQITKQSVIILCEQGIEAARAKGMTHFYTNMDFQVWLDNYINNIGDQPLMRLIFQIYRDLLNNGITMFDYYTMCPTALHNAMAAGDIMLLYADYPELLPSDPRFLQ